MLAHELSGTVKRDGARRFRNRAPMASAEQELIPFCFVFLRIETGLLFVDDQEVLDVGRCSRHPGLLIRRAFGGSRSHPEGVVRTPHVLAEEGQAIAAG